MNKDEYKFLKDGANVDLKDQCELVVLFGFMFGFMQAQDFSKIHERITIERMLCMWLVLPTLNIQIKSEISLGVPNTTGRQVISC